MQTEGRLQALFEPSRIAVIGASRHATKVGHKILANIMAAGFPGSVFPVHPGADAILGLPAVPSIERLPSGLDLAVVCLRPEATVRSVRELAAIGTRAVIVISAGFRETGIEGWRLEEELKSVTRQADMVLLGPNSLGLVNASSRLNASLASVTPQPGGAAFFSQSGALCAAVLDWAEGEQFGFSTFVSLGNKAGLNEADVLAWLGRDPAVRVVLGYVEGIDDGRAFLSQVAAVARDKPVLMVKAGATSAGARAVSAQTGVSARELYAGYVHRPTS